ncbi:hypothetical protein [Aquimarina sp. AU58]|uniref:hypothetical protein n=1 Tax=Aquimarina sp. AU58 TaxID=1874112 RepID=UPI001358DCCE|nr:hypothetical protein [Aquimarina sp. AU58]
MMKVCQYRLGLYLLFFVTYSYSQNTTSLNGEWILETKASVLYSKINNKPISHTNSGYLRVTFARPNLVDITNNYAANLHFQKFSRTDNIITLQFGRQFLIEKLTAKELVLVELENNQINIKSVRYWFIKEQLYLDKLPLKANDSLFINGNFVYRASKKLYPKFTNKKYPDFHIYMDTHIKSCYENGENFYLVTFVLKPNGKISDIEIFHRVNKEQDKKIRRAIKNSEGMWKLPKLNNKKVPILYFIEDRVNKKKTQKKLLNFAPHTFKKYSDTYYKNFHKAVLNIKQKNYEEALKYIAICENVNPNEPNLIFYNIRCYEKIGNMKKSNENKEILKNTKLKYLLK